MITDNEAFDLFQSSDLVGIGFRADALRKQLHPEGVVGYALAPEETANDEHVAVLKLAVQSTINDRVQQLSKLREEQEATQRFLCFTVMTTSQGEVTASEYVKALAIARLYLDNIRHAQVSVRNMDTKLAQVAVRFGANDLGSVSLETNGRKNNISEEQVRRLIRDAGLVPKQRDALFQTYFLY